MVNVDIDKDLYEDVKKIVKENKYDFPSVKFFIQKAVFNEIKKDDSEIERFYLKVKKMLRDDPELMERVDGVFESEARKQRRVVLR